MMEKAEVVIDSKLQRNLKSLIENIFVVEQNIEEDLDFFLSNNVSQPKKTCDKENQTIKEEDLVDRSFVFDVYVLTTKIIDPFSLEQKIFDIKNREMIHKFWEECNEPYFYKHI